MNGYVKLMRFIRIFLFLLTAGLISGSLSNIPNQLKSFICLLLVLIYTFSHISFARAGKLIGRIIISSKKKPFYKRVDLRITVQVVLLACSIPAAALSGNALGLAAFTLVVYTLYSLSDKGNASGNELPAMLLTLLLFIVYIVLENYVPQFRFAVQKLSLAISGLSAGIINRKVSLGPTYTGLSLTFLFILYHLSFLFFVKGRIKISATVYTLLSFLVSNVIFIIIWYYTANSMAITKLDIFRPLIEPFDYRLVLFLLLTFGLFIFMPRYEYKEVETTLSGRKRFAFTGIALILFTVLLLSVNFPTDGGNKRVLFYNNSPGYLQGDVPVFGKYGLENIGMFGMLPRYAGAGGYDASIVDRINGNDLKNAKVLVIMNLMQEFDSKTSKMIWDFVHKGGSLLLMGDHTGDKQIRIPSNKLLKPFNISFNFDSAIPMTDMWVNGFETEPHAILRGIKNNELQINIGASLDVKPPARPVIIGRKGFSDRGELSNINNGYLGDMRFASDERLGDLTLVADARYGKGKVLVFGDTTAFQNSAISQSHRFIDNILDWLCSDGNADLFPFSTVIPVITLCLALIILLVLFSENLLIILIYTLALGMVPYITNLVVPPGFTGNSAPLNADTALIDLSHLERVHQDKTSDSIDGIITNLIRNNYMPFIMEKFNTGELQNSKLLVISAPSRQFSRKEASEIGNYVKEGGYLILNTGWEEAGGSRELMKEFGFSVKDIPLGNITPDQNQQGVSLWKAWPVSFKDAANTRVLVKVWDYPVIVQKEYGKGAVLMIGDSSFLQNKNLEYVNSYNERNMNFLRNTINCFKEGRSIDENKK